MHMPLSIDNIDLIVVKLGSSSIVEPNGEIRLGFLGELATSIARLRDKNIGVVLVSSGAIAKGFTRLGLLKRPSDIPTKQACAAIGQADIMNMYQNLFSLLNIQTAQVLLTRDDLEDRRRYLNAREAIMRMLSLGVLPIVNENDSVSVEEIQFGDNDQLSALVAGLISADLLVLMTDVEGLYKTVPSEDSQGKLIRVVDQPIDELVSLVQKNNGNTLGTGGMCSKLEAARLCRQYGTHCIIAKSSADTLKMLMHNQPVGTYFVPLDHKIDSRRIWLSMAAAVNGTLTIDGGAAKALLKGGNSLLPRGVKNISGQFLRGSVVSVVDENGEEIARGVVRYKYSDLEKIMGHYGSEIESILNYTFGDEVIHCDNMVLIPG